jgi:single-stranded-DNA-specific exonuclease
VTAGPAEDAGPPNASALPGHGLSAPPAIMDAVGEWRTARVEAGAAERLAREAGLSTRLARLLLLRGIADGAGARAFLSPLEGPFHDPERMLGVGEAADLLVSTARRGKRVVVFGDYDVDGVTAVAQLRAALGRAGAEAAAFIPHRLRDGYGLKPETVRRVLDELAPSVIVTVDCGITAVDGVECARRAGVDVIVTDHHLVPEQLPRGAIVVNPRQKGCAYPEKELAATGIAWKIAQAVARRANSRLSSESLLRAACLGTIADLVPLTGENRSIAAAGLAALATARAPGLRALLAEAGLRPGEAPSAEDVAFRLGPRLNAAGRLDTAIAALALFEERDAGRAGELARGLSAANAERQSLERRVVAEARARIEADPGFRSASVLIEGDAGWHRGVLGIAASRLAREYHRPVLLFGLEEARASGSGRSIPGVSLHRVLSEMSHMFHEFGGHDQAVGGSLPAGRFEDFRRVARALFAQRVAPEALVRVEEADAELPLEEIDGGLVEELSRLEPHGAANPAPVFLARGVRAAEPFSPVGGSGLKGRLSSSAGRSIGCIAWKSARGGEALPRLSGRAEMDVLYRIESRRGFPLRVEILACREAAA